MNQKLLAQKLGLSQSAVSLALQGSPRIPQKTRELVAAAAAESGYRPSVAGQLLRGGRANIIGVVLPDLGNEFFAELFQNLQIELLRLGYLACLLRAGRTEELNTAVRNLRELHVAGAVALGVSPEPFFPLREEGVTLVFYGGDTPVAAPFSHVLPDRRAAAREMTGLLLAGGRRRIAFIGASHPDEQLPAGYRDALRAAGCGFELILSAADGGSLESGCRLMNQLIDSGVRVDAVFANNDVTAIGALHAAAVAGISVPDELAVAGFDNIRAGAYMLPALTTVEQPRREISAALAAELAESMRDPDHHRLIRIQCRPVIRDSV